MSKRLKPAALRRGAQGYRWYDGRSIEERCRCGHTVGAHGSQSAYCTLCTGCRGFAQRVVPLSLDTDDPDAPEGRDA